MQIPEIVINTEKKIYIYNLYIAVGKIKRRIREKRG
jgi:hypothetical protein